MLTLRSLVGLVPRPFQYGERKYLRIQPIWIAAHHGIGGVIKIAALEAPHHPVDHLRIDQRAVGRDAHHFRRLFRERSMVETIQHVVFAAPIARDAVLLAHVLDGIVRWSGGSGHHHAVHHPRAFYALNHVPQHRPLFDLRQALTRQPA